MSVGWLKVVSGKKTELSRNLLRSPLKAPPLAFTHVCFATRSGVLKIKMSPLPAHSLDTLGRQAARHDSSPRNKLTLYLASSTSFGPSAWVGARSNDAG